MVFVFGLACVDQLDIEMTDRQPNEELRIADHEIWTTEEDSERPNAVNEDPTDVSTPDQLLSASNYSDFKKR